MASPQSHAPSPCSSVDLHTLSKYIISFRTKFRIPASSSLWLPSQNWKLTTVFAWTPYSYFTPYKNKYSPHWNKPWRPRRGVEVQSYSFFNLGSRWGWVANAMPRALYPFESDPVPIVQEARWAPGPVWTVAENLVPHRDSISGTFSS